MDRGWDLPLATGQRVGATLSSNKGVWMMHMLRILMRDLDTHSEKTKDKGLRLRALDNYKKAGYDSDSLAKHAKIEND